MAQIDALNGVNSDYLGFTKTVYDKDFLDMLRGKLAAFVGAKPSIRRSLRSMRRWISTTRSPQKPSKRGIGIWRGGV